MELPDMSGLDVLHKLQNQAETAKVPCVAVTAHASPEAMRAALDAGFAAYWVKPLDACAVLEGIDSLLAIRPH
jgi:CheY-like chemotaxis protein